MFGSDFLYGKDFPVGRTDEKRPCHGREFGGRVLPRLAACGPHFALRRMMPRDTIGG